MSIQSWCHHLAQSQFLTFACVEFAINIYILFNNFSRCTCSYLTSKNTVEKLFSVMNPV